MIDPFLPLLKAFIFYSSTNTNGNTLVDLRRIHVPRLPIVHNGSTLSIHFPNKHANEIIIRRPFKFSDAAVINLTVEKLGEGSKFLYKVAEVVVTFNSPNLKVNVIFWIMGYHDENKVPKLLTTMLGGELLELVDPADLEEIV